VCVIGARHFEGTSGATRWDRVVDDDDVKVMRQRGHTLFQYLSGGVVYDHHVEIGFGTQLVLLKRYRTRVLRAPKPSCQVIFFPSVISRPAYEIGTS
jgi:hypothetical protein